MDSAIDQYNDKIVDAVKQERLNGRDWRIVDVAGILDRLASRRYQEDPLAQPAWWTPYELPPELAALTPKVDACFFNSGPNGRTRGGLFSLDGVHPTTVGYGVIAQEIVNVMQQVGVEFFWGDSKTIRQGRVQVDFNRLLRLDTLMSSPPTQLGSDLKLISWLDQSLDVFGRLNPFS